MTVQRVDIKKKRSDISRRLLWSNSVNNETGENTGECIYAQWHRRGTQQQQKANSGWNESGAGGSVDTGGRPSRQPAARTAAPAEHSNAIGGCFVSPAAKHAHDELKEREKKPSHNCITHLRTFGRIHTGVRIKEAELRVWERLIKVANRKRGYDKYQYSGAEVGGCERKSIKI